MCHLSVPSPTTVASASTYTPNVTAIRCCARALALSTEELDRQCLSSWHRSMIASSHRLYEKLRNHRFRKPRCVFASLSLPRCDQRLGLHFLHSSRIIRLVHSGKCHSMLRNHLHHHISFIRRSAPTNAMCGIKWQS